MVLSHIAVGTTTGVRTAMFTNGDQYLIHRVSISILQATASEAETTGIAPITGHLIPTVILTLGIVLVYIWATLVTTAYPSGSNNKDR